MKQRVIVVYKKKKDIAGLFLFLAGFIMFMGILTAGIFYPYEYSIRDDEISDLAATKPPDSIITQPSASIFNSVMIISGIFIILASILIHAVYHKYFFSMPMIFLGIGVVGVGIFPANIVPLHSIFAFIIFFSGSISVIVTAIIARWPLNYVFVCLGMISLFFLFFNPVLIGFLGKGGAERWIVYPIVFWMMGFGSYIVGTNEIIT